MNFNTNNIKVLLLLLLLIYLHVLNNSVMWPETLSQPKRGLNPYFIMFNLK